MVRGDIDWALGAIGLEPEEARLYRTLVAQGPSTVGTLAPAVDMSRTKTYSVLGTMVTKGYAEQVAEHPKTYTAVDPRVLTKGRLEDLRSAETVIVQALQPLYDDQQAASRSMSLRGSAVFRRAEEMLKRARRDVVFVATFVPASLVSRLSSLFTEVHARGVRVRTVVSEAVAESEMVRRLRGITEVRVRNVPNAGMLIVDDQEVLIGSLSGPEGEAGARPSYRVSGHWSRDSELIKLHRMLFEDLFASGVDR